jgi:hypothetical protein
MNSNSLYGKAEQSAGNSYRIACILSLVITSVLLLYRVLLIFSYNGELAGIDNNFVYDVSRSIEGIGPFTHPGLPPYAITLYSPFYFTVCGTIGKVLQVNPDNAISVYQLCRTVSLIADALTCILLYFVLRKRFHLTRELSWLAIAGFACILCKLGYTFSRSDSFLLVFYSALIYVLTSKSPKGIWHLFLLSAFSVGCLLSKQNGIIAPVIVITWHLLLNKRKEAAYYSIFFLVLGAGALFIYRISYPYLFLNTITALQNRLDMAWFYSDIFKRMMDSLWMLPLYFGAILSLRQWFNPAKAEDKCLAAILIIQVLFGLAISLKWGSSVSYFNEGLLLAFIVLFRKLADVQHSVGVSLGRKVVVATVPLLLLFFVHTLTEGYLFFIQHRDNKKMLYTKQVEIRDYLRPKLKGRYVLSLASPNTSFFKTLFYKEMAVPNVDMADCCTIPDQSFDYSFLRQDLTNGKIGFLLTNENDKPSTLWNVTMLPYIKDTVIHGYAIYTFRPEAGNSTQ